MAVPFSRRHIGPSEQDAATMLRTLGARDLDALIEQVVPEAIRLRTELALPQELNEEGALKKLRATLSANKLVRSFIGLGYYDTFTPPVIQRNILENPGWYTAYTPYQAEISQGRLEALLNYQTMVCSLTGLDVANASLLDEGTAAAEALTLAAHSGNRSSVFIDKGVFPHTIDVVRTRLEPLGIQIVVGDWKSYQPSASEAAVLVQYPAQDGQIHDYTDFLAAAKAAGALSIVATDLLALTLIKPPGEFGADIAIGNSQRFGVPLGFGGPHAAFMAVKDDLKRKIPGRLIGVSIDSCGRPAYRLSLQTREQHIRREKATSNICTAQVLLAVMASMYAVYHGPDGLQDIARRVHRATAMLARALKADGFEIAGQHFFDTIVVTVPDASAVVAAGLAEGFNLRHIDGTHVGISLDERVTRAELLGVLRAFGITKEEAVQSLKANVAHASEHLPQFSRGTPFLSHPVFNRNHSETEMMRYLRRLESKDIALNRSMIPLGSCTMKLNAAAEMFPVTWPEVGGIHPLVPKDQSAGYRAMFDELESWLAEITGFAAVSLQPNAGSQGEYAGLLAIRRYHLARGDASRNVCLIPVSAHGTNPASAVMAGMSVVAVKCDEQGNISLDDLTAQLEKHSSTVSAIMITYPSTHGVFEESVIEICQLAHQHGAQVYMDGANMNAQVGLTSPGTIGADVCHLNLHKTFCIPHGGGGPGVGPIGVAAHLKPFLPGHRDWPDAQEGAVCSAPWGSASIDVISWMYIAMMGEDGLTSATKHAILNANYIATRLSKCFPVLYTGTKGRVAHECILDFRGFKSVTVEDVAKRLIDYGYHAPTMSWPVPGTLMIEPTESESLHELDRFCSAMEQIHVEIMKVEKGEWDAKDNPLKNAPHTADVVTADSWNHSYTRQDAAYPLAWVKDDKYWPPVGRVDNVYGDRNIVCTCPSVEELASAS
ncbi:MAG: aminomethyl-transferring glycine dehydrogenase [Verrucomicrobiaceae bacterium]|nr:aminomethyl-transferring glycine dehydrogenase [Verrucomicrobiaceae bacterium]